MKINSNRINSTKRFKLILILLLLIFCCSFVSGENHKNHPKEIDCIVNKYITTFSDWEELSKQGTEANPLFWLLADKIIDKSQVISYRQFKISKSKKKRDCFWVEIWQMRSSADAEKLLAYCNESVYEGWDFYMYKPPKSWRVFENYFIWINACSFEFEVDVVRELDKICKMCFE